MQEIRHRTLIGFFLAMTLAGGAYSYYSYQQNVSLENKVQSLELELKKKTLEYDKVKGENDAIISTLIEERQKNSQFSAEIDRITNNVEALERLARTDPELLKKYSKVYFLNENYEPSELTNIDTKYLYNKDKPLLVHDRVWMFLKNLLDAAQSDGIDLSVISAHRSFGTQALLKSGYKITYGAGSANSFSADQGYSEHQLGTAIDFTTSKVAATFAGFDKTPAYTWLQANAYKYGFILSYPKNNSYYVFEPWHWRFVGLDLAERLQTEGKYFYDLDQRTIDSYLGTLFNARTTPATMPV